MKKTLTRLLRFSERYTKTDMVYLASGTGWLTFVRSVASFVSLGATIVLANTLQADGFGTYKFALSLFGIVSAFSLSGMNTAITRAVARGAEGMVQKGYRVSMMWSGPMMLVAFGGALYYFSNHNNDLAIALVIIAASSPFIVNASIYDAFFVGRKDFKAQAWFGSIYNAVPLVTTALIAYLTHDALVVIATYFIVSAITTLTLYKVAIRLYRPNESTDDETLSYGKHLSFMSVLGNISSQLDRILIFHWFGAVQVGLYAVATAAPQQLRCVGKVLNTLASPKFASGSLDTFRQSLPRKAFLLFLASAVISATYILLAPLFFSVFFPGYLDALVYSQVFALMVIFSPSSLFQQLVTTHAQTKTLYVMQISGPILKTILLFVLLPLWGIWGAILTGFILEVARFVFVVTILYRLPASTRTPVDIVP